MLSAHGAGLAVTSHDPTTLALAVFDTPPQWRRIRA